jgi:hypothetical protein
MVHQLSCAKHGATSATSSVPWRSRLREPSIVRVPDAEHKSHGVPTLLACPSVELSCHDFRYYESIVVEGEPHAGRAGRGPADERTDALDEANATIAQQSHCWPNHGYTWANKAPIFNVVKRLGPRPGGFPFATFASTLSLSMGRARPE